MIWYSYEKLLVNHSERPLEGSMDSWDPLSWDCWQRVKVERNLGSSETDKWVLFVFYFQCWLNRVALSVSTLSHWQDSLCSICFLLFDICLSWICHLKQWPGAFYSITVITTWPCTQPNNNNKKYKLYFSLGEGIVGVLS